MVYKHLVNKQEDIFQFNIKTFLLLKFQFINEKFVSFDCIGIDFQSTNLYR